MGKREKILVIFMTIVILYGGFELLFHSPELSGEDNSDSYIRTARDVTEKVENELENLELSASQNHILELSAEEWKNDPFYVLSEAGNVHQEELPRTGESDGFNYTVYLEVGHIRMAIIDDMEYRVGQELEQGGGIVRSISPGKVVIEMNTGKTISVFYKE